MHVQSTLISLLALANLGAAKCPVDDVSIIANTGDSVGREEVHDGGEEQ